MDKLKNIYNYLDAIKFEKQTSEQERQKIFRLIQDFYSLILDDLENYSKNDRCEICNTKEISKLLVKNFQGKSELCFVGGNGKFPNDMFSKYCPNCGRKLK